MISGEVIRAIAFSVPLVGALVCLSITVLDTTRSANPVHRKIHRRAMATYGVFALGWFLLVSHTIFPALFLWTLPLLAALAILGYILLYRMVCTITDSGDGKGLQKGVYVAPAAMLVVMVVLWLVFPVDRIAGALYATPVRSPFVYLITGTCFIYSVACPVMSLARIIHFRRRGEEIKGAAGATPAMGVSKEKFGNTYRKTLNRLFWSILFEVIAIPVPILCMLLGIEPFTHGGPVWLLAVVPSQIINIISCFNLLSDNYIIIETDSGEQVEEEEEYPAMRLSRERVELYIDNKKPYLNPSFRINDMAEDLFTNRAYISAFINTEYGVNFNRFVNGYRLREVERLREEASRKNRHVPSLQLILNAGFSNYRSYLRAREIAMGESGGEIVEESPVEVES